MTPLHLPHSPADRTDMEIAGYEILSLTQHWRLIDGAVYRDALARRLSDGALRLVSVLDES